MTDLERLGQAVKRLQYRHHRGMDLRLAELGTTLAQWDALRAIDRAPGSSARDLAATTFQKEQSFGTLATRLERKGLIERTQGRGRRLQHHLTGEGRRVLQAGRPIVVDVLEASLAALSTSRRDDLLSLLLAALDE